MSQSLLATNIAISLGAWAICIAIRQAGEQIAAAIKEAGK